jgi:hypothetical protein
VEREELDCSMSYGMLEESYTKPNGLDHMARNSELQLSSQASEFDETIFLGRCAIQIGHNVRGVGHVLDKKV